VPDMGPDALIAVNWQNQCVKPKQSRQASPAMGVVKWFSADEGWGVIEAPAVPGDCFVHFSSIRQPGYRKLHAGQHVRFTFEHPGFQQDGCAFRALEVWPAETADGS
jgi:cold shock protein